MPPTRVHPPAAVPRAAAPVRDDAGAAVRDDAVADPLRDALAADPLAEGPTVTEAPSSRSAAAPPVSSLPLVTLPSRFKPAAFFKASQTRGIRPRALKAIDDQLAAVDLADDPMERFERLTVLQRTVDGYLFRLGKDDGRGNVTYDLKRWLDGAVTLREPLFRASKANSDR